MKERDWAWREGGRDIYIYKEFEKKHRREKEEMVSESTSATETFDASLTFLPPVGNPNIRISLRSLRFVNPSHIYRTDALAIRGGFPGIGGSCLERNVRSWFWSIRGCRGAGDVDLLGGEMKEGMEVQMMPEPVQGEECRVQRNSGWEECHGQM